MFEIAATGSALLDVETPEGWLSGGRGLDHSPNQSNHNRVNYCVGRDPYAHPVDLAWIWNPWSYPVGSTDGSSGGVTLVSHLGDVGLLISVRRVLTSVRPSNDYIWSAKDAQDPTTERSE